uniref:Amino acid transporter n=1 Tax=Ditylenchus dipsaci TaxID=166011 RepID=A0A915E6K5_9BILA
MTLFKKKKKLPWENVQLFFAVSGVFMGVLFGFGFRQSGLSDQTIDMIGFPGEILINVLKSCEMPLIASSLCKDRYFPGLADYPGHPSIKSEYYEQGEDTKPANISAIDKFMDLVRNMVPDNIFRATFQQLETEYMEPSPYAAKNILVMQSPQRYVNEMNVLGLISCFIIIDLVMGHLGDKAKPLAEMFVTLELLITTTVGILLWYSPIGIASLIAAEILKIKDLIKTMKMLSVYVATVILGLAIQLFITVPAIHYYASRENPYVFMKGLAQAGLTAFGTASSSASLPVTFKCLEENNGVNPNEAVASIFIAQMNGLELDVTTVFIISITAAFASIGASALPGAGMVTMLVVLTAVGLPASDVSMIIAVDWLFTRDRLRTTVNVITDGFGCAFVEAMVDKRYGTSEKIDLNLKELLPTTTKCKWLLRACIKYVVSIDLQKAMLPFLAMQLNGSCEEEQVDDEILDILLQGSHLKQLVVHMNCLDPDMWIKLQAIAAWLQLEM